MRLTQRAHEAVAEVLTPGDLALDATAGNGHDTVFLAEQVGDSGCVWAFDVQEAAIAESRRRLEAAGLAERGRLIHDSHARMARYLPDDARGKIAAVMFNLGYLPGSDRRLVTDAGNTLAALDAALELLRPGGLVSLMVYRGHPGGNEEWRAIEQWLSASSLSRTVYGDPGTQADTPLLVLIQR